MMIGTHGSSNLGKYGKARLRKFKKNWWLLMYRSPFIGKRIMKVGMGSSLCPFYRKQMEMDVHLFFNCFEIMTIWFELGELMEINVGSIFLLVKK